MTPVCGQQPQGLKRLLTRVVNFLPQIKAMGAPKPRKPSVTFLLEGSVRCCVHIQ